MSRPSVRNVLTLPFLVVALACTPQPGSTSSSSGSPGVTLDAGASMVDAGGTVHVDAGLDAAYVRPDGGLGCVALEVCGDGLDNTCDGQVDEGCTCTLGAQRDCYDGEPGRAGLGVCTLGHMECVAVDGGLQWGTCVGSGYPQPVRCGGGKDYLCTGMVDEGCDCPMGTARACYTGPSNTLHVGLCTAGRQRCEVNEQGQARFGPCTNEVKPRPERCDGLDYDCDGTLNTGCGCVTGSRRACYSGPMGSERVGLCHGGEQECVTVDGGGSTWGACAEEVVPTPEACDGRDLDCDGLPNTGCDCTVGRLRDCYSGPSGTQDVGQCHGGQSTCIRTDGGSGWSACGDDVVPRPNVCDGVDRLCNGLPSTGCPCEVGTTQACYGAAPETVGRGVCVAGTQVCEAGDAGMGTWAGTCQGAVEPSPEVCGNGVDEDCTGMADDGCNGTVTCPADLSVAAGEQVMLTAVSHELPVLTWTILDAPEGGAQTSTWAPSPPTGNTVGFTPILVGVYQVQVSGMDRSGSTRSCTFNVSSVSHGLRVELSWDGSGDVDLHIHNGNTTPWFGGGDDCYFGFRDPPWGANLDTDNTVQRGPENIRINAPVAGEQYTIGIHNWGRAAGRIATVKVYCGTTAGITPNQVFVSHALADEDFWKVAGVTFDALGACTITTLDTYVVDSLVYGAF